MSVTDLTKVRAEKQPVCEFCGEPEHKGTYACPRLKSITFDNENDTITVRFKDFRDVPSDGQ